MDAATQILRLIRPALRHFPAVKGRLASLDVALTKEKHELAQHFPSLIRPQIRLMHIAITAACNLRCIGCRYGRDFMPGKSLPMSIIKPLLEDASEAGVRTVRLYGGEPLLHKDLPEIIRIAKGLQLNPYVTTNAILLGEKIDVLFEAGLRTATVGFYGDGASYDDYVQRSGSFERLDRSIGKVRHRYGNEVKLQINFLLCRPSCTRDAVRSALEFAERYSISSGFGICCSRKNTSRPHATPSFSIVQIATVSGLSALKPTRPVSRRMRAGVTGSPPRTPRSP